MPLNIDELKHSAINPYGVKLRGFIKEAEEDRFVLIETGTNKELGYIDFTILPEKKVVFINDMANLVRQNKGYKGIGSLLYEFVFYHLAEKNIEYSIQLTKAYGSSPFHYLCGFRFKYEKANQLMENLISLGPEIYRNKENTKHFPETMIMSVETLKTKKEKYLPVAKHPPTLK